MAMKKIPIIFAVPILYSLILGCAHDPMKFKANPGLTNDDYAAARIECGGAEKSGGYFAFGPAIILLPVMAVVEGYRYSKRGSVLTCMEARGFKCIENCPTVNLSSGAQPGSSAPAK
jgi:hypothetical protein